MLTAIFLSALMMVETGGDCSKVGDDGLAYGAFQIHIEVVLDVNRKFGTHYRWPADAVKLRTATEIVQKYIQIYATEERIGREPTLEDCARIWNGGPNGYKKKATEPYWRKVKHYLGDEK